MEKIEEQKSQHEAISWVDKIQEIREAITKFVGPERIERSAILVSRIVDKDKEKVLTDLDTWIAAGIGFTETNQAFRNLVSVINRWSGARISNPDPDNGEVAADILHVLNGLIIKSAMEKSPQFNDLIVELISKIEAASAGELEKKRAGKKSPFYEGSYPDNGWPSDDHAYFNQGKPLRRFILD